MENVLTVGFFDRKNAWILDRYLSYTRIQASQSAVCTVCSQMALLQASAGLFFLSLFGFLSCCNRSSFFLSWSSDQIIL